jgi:hypothetical protein
LIDSGLTDQEELADQGDEDDSPDDPYADEDAETLLQRAIDSVAQARRAPLSASVLIGRDELLDLLQAALEKLPDEVRRARWLLKEQEEFIAQRRREADTLLEEVRVQAERMVQRTEIVRQAQLTADQILDGASEEARRLKYEAEDFCDQRLANFEIVLDRTLKTVQAGREKLQAVPTPVAPEVEGDEEGENAAFFDQDEY